MAKSKPTIEIKVSEVAQAWNILNDLIQVNDNPFKGNARRLGFKLQPEVKFLQSCDDKDYEAVKDKKIQLGEKIPPPTDFPDEYSEFLGKICTSVPVKSSKIESLLNKKK